MKHAPLMQLCAAIALVLSEAPAQALDITITNPSDLPRVDEIVELDAAPTLVKMGFNASDPVVLRDAATQKEIPLQSTYNNKLIFQVSLAPKASVTYSLEAGAAQAVETKVFGTPYAIRADDFAWENDKIAFRAYGPALQAAGERAFGYDVLVKSVPRLVVDERYQLVFGAEAQAKLAELSRTDSKAYQAMCHDTSFHIDHGNGMDFYNVGPTLGPGTAALMDEKGQIVYPYCYKSCKILDNGPLRFSFQFVFNPQTIDGKSDVVETRVITLDAGSQMNKTEISYSNLDKATPVMAGLVMREAEGKAQYVADAAKGYATYATCPDVPSAASNGVVYVGAVFTQAVDEAKAMYFTPEDKGQRGGATGHTALISSYAPNSTFTYYWGAGWSKFGFATFADWNKYVEQFAQKLQEPLEVKF